MPPAADKPRRRYYSELTDEEKSRLRMMSVVNAQSASDDLEPRGCTDELLAAELAHRRTEVELLAADIADRQAGGGPHTRQVLAGNAELSKRAEKIVPAQQARTAAEEILAEHQRLATRKQNLQWQLDQTPDRGMLARKKLHTQITETEAALEDLAPKLTAAETAAKAAAEATLSCGASVPPRLLRSRAAVLSTTYPGQAQHRLHLGRPAARRWAGVSVRGVQGRTTPDDRLLIRQGSTDSLVGRQGPPTTTSASGTAAGASSGIGSATAAAPPIRTLALNNAPSIEPRTDNRDLSIEFSSPEAE
ncbi:hypothetical protein [Nocardia asiatica]|uniref:hypothetical protein n=1 Tax=Nocardia asiatica TaxID=209252 RepID=UPI002455CD60|nr:hypothetical protein [Nocardia asiatica]